MLRRIAGLVRKEFAQMGRDVPLLVILVWAFTFAVYTAGQGRTGETSEIATAVYDLSRTPASREFLSHLQRPYFKVIASLTREEEVTRYLEDGAAAVVVIVPPDFHRDIAASRPARVQVLTDGALPIQATVSIAYLATISARYAVALLDARSAVGGSAFDAPAIDERLRVKFNPNMLSSWFASLLELLNMCTMVSLLLTAANLVREKERGTMERLLVSPARPIEVFVAKIAPTIVVVVALSACSMIFVLGPAFGLPIRGSLLLFLSVTALYVFAMTSMGIVIALLARNMAQAVLMMILILQPMVFLSGAWNPPEAMSPWLRHLSAVSPLRYYIDVGFGIVLKGNGLAVLTTDVLAIALLGAVMFALSLFWFDRRINASQ